MKLKELLCVFKPSCIMINLTSMDYEHILTARIDSFVLQAFGDCLVTKVNINNRKSEDSFYDPDLFVFLDGESLRKNINKFLINEIKKEEGNDE